jgi:hypothetical protein
MPKRIIYSRMSLLSLCMYSASLLSDPTVRTPMCCHAARQGSSSSNKQAQARTQAAH